MNLKDTVRAGLYCALAGAALLILMAIVGLAAGSTIGVLDQPVLHPPYAPAIEPASKALARLMALDYLFLIAYSGTFLGTAALLWRRAGIWAAAGLGFGLLTALVDITENAFTVSIARQAQALVEISGGALQALGILGQVKYACASLALVFLAVGLLVAMPARRSLVLGVAAVLLIFPVVNSLTVINPSLGLLLVLWMLVSLLAAALLLAKATPGE